MFVLVKLFWRASVHVMAIECMDKSIIWQTSCLAGDFFSQSSDVIPPKREIL